MKTRLRPWQQKHLDKCKSRLESGHNIFLSQAVTGAGKTTLGVLIAKHLLDSGLVQRVVVLCPSIEIADGWIAKFGDAGIIASRGNINTPDVVSLVVTYASGSNIPSGPARTLVILDEIHHAEREETWGITATTLANHAKFTVALTGTPWMTTGTIAILEKHGYYKPDGRIESDAEYSYAEDLRTEGDDRATVPVSFVFIKSTSSRVVPGNGDQGPRTETLVLEAVTDDNKDRIKDPEQTNHDTPLGPHVTIEDDMLSNNAMARELLGAAVAQLSSMRMHPSFRKGPKPMGLVTCRTIKEARRVKNYMEKTLGQSVELIVSKDENDADNLKSAVRLRAISNGSELNPPTWIVSVGMVSEGVDIPAIKVIGFLNQITTLLFLIQLFGRALRRIKIRSEKDADGLERTVYADEALAGTRAFVFAPAHPFIVKTGLDLEDISNQAVAERQKKGQGKDPVGPREIPRWNTKGGEQTEFYRGCYIQPKWRHSLLALESDEVAVSKLGQFWFGMILDWIKRDMNEEVNEEIRKRIEEFDISTETTTETRSRSYDEETASLRTRAQSLTQLLRFTHPKFKPLPDESAYVDVRKCVTIRLLGRWKEFSKLSLDEKNRWVKLAEKIHAEECNG